MGERPPPDAPNDPKISDVDTQAVDAGWDEDLEPAPDGVAPATDAPGRSSATIPGPPPESRGRVVADPSAIEVSEAPPEPTSTDPFGLGPSEKDRLPPPPGLPQTYPVAGQPSAHTAPSPEPVAVPTLGTVLAGRVRVGKLVAPAWLLAAGAILAASGLVLVLSLAATSPKKPGAEDDAAPAGEGPAPSDLEARAAAGDDEALAAIEAKTPAERSVGEVIAASRGELAKKHAELGALELSLKENAALLREPKWQALLRKRAYEEDIYRETLEMLAGLNGPEGPDMLYLLWTATPARTAPTALAERLVYTRQVRAKASPALAVALDLREAEACEAFLALLPRAAEHADHRSLVQLNRLKVTTGCGAQKKDDCYPCLREGTALEDAIKAVSRRPPPRY